MTEKKIALITGANKGIGKEIARQLGAQGMTVLSGRGMQGAGRRPPGNWRGRGLTPMPSRWMSPMGKHRGCGRAIEGEHGRLDVLVNNAGIALDNGPASTLDVDTLRRTYETNVFGVAVVTQAMLPLLKRSEAGRIVNMSSGLGSLAQNSDPNWEFAGAKPLAYNSSKAALNMISVIFAAELKDTPIKVNAADPGFTATDLNQHRGPRTVQQGATAAVRLATLPADGPTGGYFNENGVVPW